MIRKMCFTALLIAVVVATGHAASSDNTAPLPGEKKSGPSGGPSYFEGVWVGSWRGFYSPGTTQDITLTIEKGAKEGVFIVNYSWGMVQFKNRTAPAGSLKTRGQQQGDQFIIQWKTKQGNENQITLQKESENKVKAKLDRGGTLPPGESPTVQTYLDRK